MHAEVAVARLRRKRRRGAVRLLPESASGGQCGLEAALFPRGVAPGAGGGLPPSAADVGRDGRRFVGAVGLLPDPKRECPGVAMLGYWLDEACWGRGLMTEAARAVVGYGFSQLGLEMVTATCYPHNERSRRVLERLGFRFGGVIHRAVQDHRGVVSDLCSFYLPRDIRRNE